MKEKKAIVCVRFNLLLIEQIDQLVMVKGGTRSDRIRDIMESYFMGDRQALKKADLN